MSNKVNFVWLVAVMLMIVSLTAYPQSAELDKAFEEYEKGNIFSIRKRAIEWGRAIIKYKEILKANPHDGDAYYHMAVASFLREDYEEAVKYYDKSQELGFSGNPEFRLWLEPYRYIGKKELSLTLSANKKTFTLNEPIVISAKLSNIGNRKISFWSGPLKNPLYGFSKGQYRKYPTCEVINWEGKTLNISKRFDGPRSLSDYEVINPGDTKVYEFDIVRELISRLWEDKYSTERNYKIVYHYYGRNYFPEDNKIKPVEFAWVGELTTEPLEITIVSDINVLLRDAIREQKSEIVRRLLAQGANPNDTEILPLGTALFTDNYEIVLLLIEKGARVNVKNWQGDDILYSYVSGKMLFDDKVNDRIVRVLLDKGAIVDDKLLECAKPRKYLESGAFWFQTIKYNPNYQNEKKIYNLLLSRSKQFTSRIIWSIIGYLLIIAMGWSIFRYALKTLPAIVSEIKHAPKQLVFYAFSFIALYSAVIALCIYSLDIDLSFLNQEGQGLSSFYNLLATIPILLISIGIIFSWLEILQLKERGRKLFLWLAIPSLLSFIVPCSPTFYLVWAFLLIPIILTQTLTVIVVVFLISIYIKSTIYFRRPKIKELFK